MLLSTFACVRGAALIGAAIVAGALQAQTPEVGVMEAPCNALPPAPAPVAAYFKSAAEARAAHQPVAKPDTAALALYNDWQKLLLASDFPGRCHYHDANAKLPAAAGRRVIFFGDSVTELWGANAPDLFTGDVIDRGVSGQTTEQMLGRFRTDVIDLHPRAVHIVAGTNDIAGNTGPTTLAWVEENIETMVAMAQAQGIIVILGAVPPAARFAWRPEIASVAPIAAYNAWLKVFADSQHIAFVDYHAALDNGHGGIRSGLSDDGVHPNGDGFKVMTPLALNAIDRGAGVMLRAPQNDR